MIKFFKKWDKYMFHQVVSLKQEKLHQIVLLENITEKGFELKLEKVKLKELNIKTRKEGILFLKKLWNEEDVNCPICDNKLEILHKKAKRDNCDWQCKKCNKTYKTLHLLDELNDQIPNQHYIKIQFEKR